MQPIGANERAKIQGAINKHMKPLIRKHVPRVLCRYNQMRSNFRKRKFIPVNNNAENKAPPSCIILLSLIRSYENEIFFYLGELRIQVQSRHPKMNIQFWRMEYHLGRDQSVKIWNGSRTCLQRKENRYLTDRNGWVYLTCLHIRIDVMRMNWKTEYGEFCKRK